MNELTEREPNWITLRCLRDSAFEGVIRFKKGELYEADVLNKHSARVTGDGGYDVYFIGKGRHWMGETFEKFDGEEVTGK